MADKNTIKQIVPRLLNQTIQYGAKGIQNCSEYGQLFRSSTKMDFYLLAREGNRNLAIKHHILACCNRSLTERFSLIIIGRRTCPRAFGEKNGTQLGFGYQANSRAWSSWVLFFNLIVRFNAHSLKVAGRRALSILNNFTAHSNTEFLPVLLNVTVRFLPSQTTSHIQPCDAGLITCLKSLYMRKLLMHFLDQKNFNVKDIYESVILTAIK